MSVKSLCSDFPDDEFEEKTKRIRKIPREKTEILKLLKKLTFDVFCRFLGSTLFYVLLDVLRIHNEVSFEADDHESGR